MDTGSLKICRVCKRALHTSYFNKNKNLADSLQTECRECQLQYRKGKIDEKREYDSKYRENNKEKCLDYLRKYRNSLKEANPNYNKEHYLKYKDAIIKRNKEYYQKNKENISKKGKIKFQETKDLTKEIRTLRKKIYDKTHKEIVNRHGAERRAIKLRATPSWGNTWIEKLRIQEIYIISETRTSVTGVRHHVDHIIPLISKLVQGFHCSNNLQIILYVENLSKGNRVWPNMPD